LGLSTKYMLLIALPVGAVFLVLGDVFISLWVGPGYSASATILTILTIALIAHFLEMGTHSFLLALGNHRIIARLTFIQAIINLGLSIILVRPFGLAGVALGTAIPMIFFSIIGLIVYFRAYLKFPLGDYIYRSVLPPFALQVPFVGLLLLIKTYIPPSSIPLLFFEIAVALVPYIGLALMICTSSIET